MATTPIKLLPRVWTEISTVSVDFQAQGNDIKVVDSETLPTADNHPGKICIVNRMYEFDKIVGNLYGYSEKGSIVMKDLR
jgi:hypothetical protein